MQLNVVNGRNPGTAAPPGAMEEACACLDKCACAVDPRMHLRGLAAPGSIILCQRRVFRQAGSAVTVVSKIFSIHIHEKFHWQCNSPYNTHKTTLNI